MPIANTNTPEITYFSMIYVMPFKKSVFIRREKKQIKFSINVRFSKKLVELIN